MRRTPEKTKRLKGMGGVRLSICVNPAVGRSASASEFCRLADNPTGEESRASLEACAVRLISAALAKAFPKQKGGGG